MNYKTQTVVTLNRMGRNLLVIIAHKVGILNVSKKSNKEIIKEIEAKTKI